VEDLTGIGSCGHQRVRAEYLRIAVGSALYVGAAYFTDR